MHNSDGRQEMKEERRDTRDTRVGRWDKWMRDTRMWIAEGRLFKN